MKSPLEELLACRTMTEEEWLAYPKDGFDTLMKRWCERNRFVEYGRNDKVYTRLPYRRHEDGTMRVAEDFLALVGRHRALARGG